MWPLRERRIATLQASENQINDENAKDRRIRRGSDQAFVGRLPTGYEALFRVLISPSKPSPRYRTYCLMFTS